MDIVGSLKPIVDLFGALLSPLIAITVTYIAYQQWIINRQKVHREIRSSKIDIYLRVKRFLRNVDKTTKVDSELYQDFQQAVAEADFLLNEELTDWLDEVDSVASCWISINDNLERAENDPAIRKDIQDYDAWKKEQAGHLLTTMDTLLIAHCDLLGQFQKIVSTEKEKS